MYLKLVESDKNEQAPLSGSLLLKRWTRAQERLALIKSQESGARGSGDCARSHLQRDHHDDQELTS